jgi:hypothetical protein
MKEQIHVSKLGVGGWRELNTKLRASQTSVVDEGESFSFTLGLPELIRVSDFKGE